MNTRINELRIARGMSVRELAKLSGVSISTINRVITGTHTPNFYTLTKLVEALGCTIDEATIVLSPAPTSAPLPESISEKVFHDPIDINSPPAEPVTEIIEELAAATVNSPEAAVEQFSSAIDDLLAAKDQVIAEKQFALEKITKYFSRASIALCVVSALLIIAVTLLVVCLWTH